MIYEITLTVVADLPQAYEGPEMVAELWASGLVQGIKHNRPEVVGVTADVQRLDQEFPLGGGELEDRAQGGRKELPRGETPD